MYSERKIVVPEKYSFKREFPLFFISFVVLALVFQFVLLGYCVHHDDLYYFVWNSRQLTKHPQFMAFALLYGRPLGALIYVGEGYLIETISDANFVRLIHVFIVSLISFVIYSWLRITHTKLINAFLLSISICVLPAFLVTVFWSTQIINSYAVLTSSLSAILLSKVALERPSEKSLEIFYLIAAIGLLMISPFIHQNGAMFFWVIFAIFILYIPAHSFSWKKLKRPIIYYFSVFGFSMAFYFFIYKIVLIPLSVKYGFVDNYNTPRATLAIDPLGKLKWFFGEPLNNALNLWNIFPVKKITILVVAIIIIGFFLELMTCYKIKDSEYKNVRIAWRHFQKSIFIIFLILLSFLPNFATHENNSMYHTLICLTALLLLLFYRGINQLVDVLPVPQKENVKTGVLSLITVIALFTASNNVLNYQGLPCSIEQRYIKSVIKQNDLSKYDTFHIIKPRPNDFFAKRHRYGEFGVPSSFWWHDVPGVVRSVLFDLKIKKEEMQRFRFTSSYSSEPVQIDNKTLIIDVTKLKYFR